MRQIIDLFSGAGGLTEGFHSEDFEIVGHVEKNYDACQTLCLRESFHYLESTNRLDIYESFLHGDISHEEVFEQVPHSISDTILNVEINDSTLLSIFDYFDNYDNKNGGIDGIIGGPPCQAYSTIGRARNASKKGHDQRIYLYKYYIEFLKRYTPKFFVFENVKGLLSFKDVNQDLLFPKMQREFQESGYSLDYKIINTADYGVPQNRERLIIFGVLHERKELISDFFERLSSMREIVKTVSDAFEDLPVMHSGETVNIYNKFAENSLTKYYRGIHNLPLTQNTARFNNLNDLAIYKIVATAKQHGKNIRYCDLDNRLITHKHTDKFLDRYKALSWNSPSHTVVAHIAKDGHHYIHPDIKQNRSITVREAARLQGFPDSYYFLKSRTSAFTQIGNAVPPILSKKIALVISNMGL